MNLIKLKQSEELAGLSEHCIAKSSSVSSSSLVATNDIYSEPILSPRLGDDYQVEIPSLLGVSEHLTLEVAYKTGLTNPIMWVHTEDKRRELKDEIVGSTLNDRQAYVSSTYQISSCKECSPLPESRVSLWSDDEIQGFLLGLYIFGKNIVQVRKFIDCKDMKDVLAFYYGKFYHSDAYHRWADCRKTRSRKCIQGQRMFTGWRQHEVLSRILMGMSKEVQESLLKAIKAFNEGSTSLEELVFALKAVVGVGALVKAVGIGKGKQDLTGFILESSRTNQANHSCIQIRTGKAYSAFTSNEIIEILTGSLRVSKTRSNDLFWEAVWPRLLARGWHSERPRDICSKKTLVFLIPGIRKFSRRKLVKGDQYFDSVTDVLNKVASDPRLLELQTERAKENKNFSTTVSQQRQPSDLRPRLANSNSEFMKFTVVDTSLVFSAGGSFKLRELRSMPFEVSSNDIKGICSDNSMDHSTDASSSDKDSSEVAHAQAKNIQLGKMIQQEQSACLVPLVKRQRLSACKQAMRNGCHKLLFVQKTDCNVKAVEALEGASTMGSTVEDGLHDVKPHQVLFELNQPQFSVDPAEHLGQPVKRQNVDDFRECGNQTSSPDEESSSNVRRHSTRNRPPTAKALEALASGFLNIRWAGKDLKNSGLRGTQSRSRFSHRTAEAPLPGTAVFTKAASTGFLDPNFIIPEITYHASLTEP